MSMAHVHGACFTTKSSKPVFSRPALGPMVNVGGDNGFAAARFTLTVRIFTWGMDFILRLSLAILTQFAPRLIQMDMESMIFDNNYLASQLVDCNLQRAQLAEEVIRLRGSVASMYARESTATLASASEPSTVSALTANASTAPASSSALPDKVPSITGASATASPESDLLRERDSSTSGAASWTSLSSCSGRVTSDRLMIETINQLETDLVHIRVRGAETSSSLRGAKAKIRLLEEKLDNVLRKPTEQVEVLQDELMRVKLREAEGLLQMKELRQRLDEIQSLWEEQCGRRRANKPSDLPGFLRTSTGLLHSKILGKSSTDSDGQHLSDRLLEAKYLTQIADLNQKVKELTAHQELASRQASRHDERLASLQDKLDSSLLREASLIADLKQAECTIVDVEAKLLVSLNNIQRFQRKSDGILWRIREIELNSQLAEIKQRYGELECLHDAEYASNAFRDLTRNPIVPVGATALPSAPCDSSCSSAAPTPEVRRDSEPQPIKSDSDTPRAERRTSEARTPLSFSGRLSSTWKDLPPAIMTDSIGPLEDICLLPDDPMITSIYLEHANAAEMP
ncbi:unnamed protein product [Schistocephalus solidus]|uniref:E3 ubiquitin protein ligase n=1 Tax=Schistocephalus solidus TaxID=70667 RepID=A0A183SXM3_SCHSO|nr:unnamed protein product [Schistocephalus solidus]